MKAGILSIDDINSVYNKLNKKVNMQVHDLKIMEMQLTLNAEESYIRGKLHEDKLIITAIQCYGEGSGTCFVNELTPLLEKTKGDITFVGVWENGDSVVEYRYNDGVCTEHTIV